MDDSDEDRQHDNGYDNDDDSGKNNPDPIHAFTCGLLVLLCLLNIFLGFLRVFFRFFNVLIDLYQVLSLFMHFLIYRDSYIPGRHRYSFGSIESLLSLLYDLVIEVDFTLQFELVHV